MGDNSRRFHTADADSGIRTHRFAITGAELSPGGSNIVIRLPTLPGRIYDVQWAADAAVPFLPLGSNLPHTQTNYSDTTAPPSGFYHVNVGMNEL